MGKILKAGAGRAGCDKKKNKTLERALFENRRGEGPGDEVG